VHSSHLAWRDTSDGGGIRQSAAFINWQIQCRREPRVVILMGAEAVVKGESKRSNETMTTATTAMLELKI